jgi:hypothetical protein
MTKPNESRVTVRVEVVVEGAGEAPRVTTIAVPSPGQSVRPRLPLEIHRPVPSSLGVPANTPVFAFGGKSCIDANGTAWTVFGSFPGKVWAKVYPDPNLNPNQSGFAVPPGDAVCDTPLGDGSWSFTQAKGNPVPGAVCDGISGGPNNCTLVVWYDFGSGIPCSIESTPFHGYCPGGSGASGSVSGMSGAGLGAHLPATLHATFTGALAALGTVSLAWNGATWLGLSGASGGALLAFLGNGSTYTMLSAGPGALFAVSGTPCSLAPFTWSAFGKALGSSSGAFDVTITE